LFLLAMLAAGGCSGPLMAPVKGKVTCDGKPVREAQVTFAPVGTGESEREPGKPATGFTDEDGNYVLSTNKALDGALVGEHQVNIMLDDTNPAKCTRQKRITLEVKPEENVFDIELNDEAAK
jgi:hypothetical protein